MPFPKEFQMRRGLLLIVLSAVFLNGCDFLSTLGTFSEGKAPPPAADSPAAGVPLSESLVDEVLSDLATGASATLGSRGIGPIAVSLEQISFLKIKIKLKIQTLGLASSVDVKILVKAILTTAQTALPEVLTGGDAESSRAKAIALLAKGALKAAASKLTAVEKLSMAAELAKTAVETLKDSGITTEASFREAVKNTLGQMVQSLSHIASVSDQAAASSAASLLVKSAVEALKTGMSSLTTTGIGTGTLVEESIKDLASSLVESLVTAGLSPAVIKTSVVESFKATVTSAVKIGVDDGAALAVKLSVAIAAQITVSVPALDTTNLAAELESDGRVAAETAGISSTVTPLQALSMHQNVQALFNAGDLAGLKAQFTTDPNNLPAVLAYVSRNLLNAAVSSNVRSFMVSRTTWSNYPSSVEEILSSDYWNQFFSIKTSEPKQAQPVAQNDFEWAGFVALLASEVFPVMEEAAEQLDKVGDDLKFNIRLGDLLDLWNQFLVWKGLDQSFPASALPWNIDTVVTFGKAEILVFSGLVRALASAGHYAHSLDLSSVIGHSLFVNQNLKNMLTDISFGSAAEGAAHRERSRTLLEQALASWQKAIFLFKNRLGTVYSLTPDYVKNLSLQPDLGKNLDTSYLLLGRLIKSIQGTTTYIPSDLIRPYSGAYDYSEEGAWPLQASSSMAWEKPTFGLVKTARFNFGLQMSKLFQGPLDKTTLRSALTLPSDLWMPWSGDGTYTAVLQTPADNSGTNQARVEIVNGYVASLEWFDQTGDSLVKATLSGNSAVMAYRGKPPYTATLPGTAPYKPSTPLFNWLSTPGRSGYFDSMNFLDASGLLMNIEGLYPEYSGITNYGLETELTVQISSQFGSSKTADTAIIAAIVPYAYNAEADAYTADWSAALKKQTTLGESSSPLSFKVHPQKKYRLILFVPEAGQEKPGYDLSNNTVKNAAVVKVPVSTTETKDLWSPDELTSETITGYIGNTSYFPTIIYYEIFGAPSSGGGAAVQEYWQVNGPNDFTQGTAPFTFTIQRTWASYLKEVYDFTVDVVSADNGTVVTGFDDLKTMPTNPGGNFFDLNVPGIQNLSTGTYKMVVEVRYTDLPNVSNAPKFEKFFSVFPSDGGGDAANNTPFSVGINFASGWFFTNEVAFSIYILDSVVGQYTFGYDSPTYEVGTLNSSGVSMANLPNAHNTATNLMNYHTGIRDNIELWILNNNGTPSDTMDDYWSKVIDRPIYLNNSSGGVYTLTP